MRKDDEKILRRAKRTLELEAKAVGGLVRKLGKNFLKAVGMIYDCRGRVVLTGVGKSGLIAKKIAATFSSTGTPAIFVHSAEAAHGDLGAITPEDVVIAISHSGEADEIRQLLPNLRKAGVPIIAITGSARSALASAGEVTLLTGPLKEACPLGLAPTTSAVAGLAMGDALAMALLEKRGFREEDFARLHPGGKLGKKWLRVGELMHSGDGLPLVDGRTSLLETVFVMSSGKLGVAVIVDGRKRHRGVITDGDLRRMIEKGVDFTAVAAGDVMSKNPAVIEEEEFAVQALRNMENRSITSLLVTDRKGRLKGLVHMHDLLKAGIV